MRGLNAAQNGRCTIPSSLAMSSSSRKAASCCTKSGSLRSSTSVHSSFEASPNDDRASRIRCSEVSYVSPRANEMRVMCGAAASP
eukprot:4319094-Prymnesium_polylepis.1